MENAEVDVAIEELETRLERLRALYEQYFMGIERIEPAVPRKDIDRRIYVLRREKIRNTAKRFKLQTIISRYNTFQNYWQRVCREIENGTYKRHVIRAERIAPGQILTIAARKRLGRALVAPPEDEADQAKSGDDARLAGGAPAARSEAAATPEASRVAQTAQTAPTPQANAASVEVVRGPATEVALVKPAIASAAPSPAEIPPASSSPAAPPQRTVVAGRPMPPPRPPARPAAAATAPVTAMPPVATPPPRRPSTEDLRPEAPPAPVGRALPATKPGLGAAPPPPGPVKVPPPGPVKVPPRPPTPPPRNASPAEGPPRRPPPPPTLQPAVGKPTLEPPEVSRPKPDKASGRSNAATVSEDRVRELHARLLEAKRQTQDPAIVSLEGLSKSVKATEAKLREQHKNRNIDFDVVIKDGKAVLKPIVR